MIARCENPNNEKFPQYGGRGVTVCERWHTFADFLADMGERPAGHTIDRVDNDGPYTAGNCRWSTAETQANNKSNNVLLTINGDTMSVSEWERRLGMLPGLLRTRIASGMSPEDAASRPVDQEFTRNNRAGNSHVTIGGRTQTIAQWSRETGINYHTFRMRVLRGASPEQIVSTEDFRRKKEVCP